MKNIYVNGNIITQDLKNPRAEAFITENNVFVKVGSNIEVLDMRTEQDVVIDLAGKTVTPGFNDSHVHLLNYAYSLKKVDCSNAKSAEEVIELGRKFIESNKLMKDEWVLGRGWNQILFDNKSEITRVHLDKITTEHPLSFTRICEHITVANSKALEICGITKNTPQPVGGHFDIDENGEPTGIFRESARYMIYDKIPEANKNEIKAMLTDVSKLASSLGITSVQTDDFETFASKDFKVILQAYKELIQEKKLTVRVYEQCLLPEIDRLKLFLSMGYKTGFGNEYFKIGPLKLLTDGSLGARTAYLNSPYNDDATTRGINVFTQDELDELILTAHKGGMQILTHAIGDGAIHMCFEGFRKAQGEYLKNDPRFGIVHLQITDKSLLNKFKEYNVIAYAEPVCVNNDLHMAEDRVGYDRAKTSYNYRTLADNGVHLCISSDCPVDSLNPMDSIYVAVTRKDYSGFPSGGWFPEQRLSLDQAVYSYTMESAYASFEDEIKGSIEVGKLADFVVLSDDLYTIIPDNIRNIVVEMTVMDGKIVYKREQ